MKKSFFAFCVAATAALLTLTAGAEEGQVVITRTQGQPMVLRAGEALPASMGLQCQTTDTLMTHDGAQMDVAINGKAGCRLLPQTEVSMRGAGRDMNLQISRGNIILNLDKLDEGSTFRVETPTAIASVRGTQFWGRVEAASPDNPVTTFAVREGIVEVLVKSTSQSFRLEQGQALDSPLSGAPSVVRPALAAELQAMDQADDIRTAA